MLLCQPGERRRAEAARSQGPAFGVSGLRNAHCMSQYKNQLQRYTEFLGQLLGRGFSASEIVKRWNRRFALPPEALWPRMKPTLVVANELRAEWVRRGGRGLRVAAAYRPQGGARSSQHKQNAALDLDLLRDDYDHMSEWYDLVIEYWREHAAVTRLGLGLYCAPGATGGIRAHIDTGYQVRTWQHSGGKSVRPPLARRKK